MQFEEVKELIAIFEKTDLNDMEVQLDNAIVRLNRGRTVPMAPVIPGQFPSSGPEAVFVAGKTNPSVNRDASGKDDYLSKEGIDSLLGVMPGEEKKKADDGSNSDGKFIKSPIVGTFYQSASPEKPPYINVGDKVSKGDIVCIIEAMKFMNEVTSEEDGIVEEILVEDGQFVEFGAPLFRLR